MDMPRTFPRYETRRDIWIHLLLYPGHTLPTAAAPCLVAIGLAIHDGVLALAPALAAFLCSWLVHVGGVFTDNYQLLTRHPSVREHPELNDSVQSGVLKLSTLRTATLAWYAAAIAPGFYLLHVVGPWAIALGALGVASAAWYAAGRVSMAQLGLADPIFFAMFGVVAVAATYYVQAVATPGAHALVPWAALIVGLPVGALVTNVLIIDDIRDVAFDAEKGWRTTPVRFGLRASRIEHLALTALAYLAPLLFAWRWGPWLLLPLLTLPLAIAAEHKVWTAPHRELLIPWTPRSAFLSMGYGALLGLALALAR